MIALASAADRRYGDNLLNLLGSVKTNSDVFDRIVVYDLGLSPFQRRLTEAVEGVEVREVPPFVPHWAQCFTWKPWIWTHTEADELLWLDAGVTVLRRLDDPIAQIRERGAFLVSNGQPNLDSIPRSYLEEAGLPVEAASGTGIHAGVIGFRTEGPFYDSVIRPTYEDVVAGRNLGFSPAEVSTFNFGLNTLDPVILRDAPRFRWDQTVLNLRALTAPLELVVNELDRYAGWRSPRDHPEQLIWNHRRRGDYAYVARAPFTGSEALRGRLFGARLRLRWWIRRHGWLFRPGTYVRKCRTIVRAARLARG